MKRVQISVMVPELADIVGDIETRDLYPALPAAEARLATLEQALAATRERLTEAEQTVEALPARICEGGAKESDLVAALTAKQAASLLTTHRERLVEEERQRVVEETDRSEAAVKAAVQAELKRRAELLQVAAKEFWPVLEGLRELELQLQHKAGLEGSGVTVRWPPPLCYTGRAGWKPEEK